MPAITVLMAVHNAERHVAEAIASVSRQTFRDFELLVIDDGSTDGTAAIVNRIDDPRVRYLPAERRLGLPGALNLGMENSSSPLLARHDHDDVSDPERFGRQVAYLEGHPEVAIVGSRARLIDEAGREIGRVDRCLEDISIRWYHLLDNPFIHSSVMFRRAVIWSELSGYDARLPSSEDHDLWSRVLQRHAGANLPDRLLSYRLVAASKMAADETAWEEGPFPTIHRSLVRREIDAMFRGMFSDEELGLMGGFVLGVRVADVDRFLDLFWRLCAAYEERFPAARISKDFSRTLALQVDAIATRLRPFSRGAALRVYRRSLAARPSLAAVLPWGTACGRVALGEGGRATLARWRKQRRKFCVAV
jgi:glycosyltransferase involved in cell wall biosynthesis